MKKDIHPKNYPVVFVDTSSGAEFVTISTMKTEKTKDISGTPHYIINMEISSASHPFYTGKQILVDTARRVEKFQERVKKTASVAQGRKGRKVKRAKAADKKKEEKKIASEEKPGEKKEKKAKKKTQ